MNVTIAIPFYNAEKYLTQSIQSVFAQTHKNWELLLVDDGSTDNSLNIAKSVIDDRVRVISDGQNKKLATRLNEITNEAKYDIIVRMDADDLMMPDRIEKQLKVLIENDLDLITTGVYSVLNNLKLVGIRGEFYNSISFDELINKKKGITHAALIAKKSWYKRNKYDESLKIAQDYDLWLKSSLKNDLKIISLKEPLYIYREEDNVTAQKILKAYKNERKMIKKYHKKAFNLLLLKSYLKTIIVLFLKFINKLDVLLNKRGNSIISDKDISLYQEALIKIQNTKVNGLNK